MGGILPYDVGPTFMSKLPLQLDFDGQKAFLGENIDFSVLEGIQKIQKSGHIWVPDPNPVPKPDHRPGGPIGGGSKSIFG